MDLSFRVRERRHHKEHCPHSKTQRWECNDVELYLYIPHRVSGNKKGACQKEKCEKILRRKSQAAPIRTVVVNSSDSNINKNKPQNSGKTVSMETVKVHYFPAQNSCLRKSILSWIYKIPGFMSENRQTTEDLIIYCIYICFSLKKLHWNTYSV